MRSDSLSREYENRSKAPFYLYSGAILIGLFIASCIALSIFSGHQRDKFIDHPQTGDVYLVKRELPAPTAWYFLRIARIHGDTAVVYHGNLEYNASVYQFASDDFFVSGETIELLTSQLKTMYQKGTIVSVFRDYDDTGFSRIK